MFAGPPGDVWKKDTHLARQGKSRCQICSQPYPFLCPFLHFIHVIDGIIFQASCISSCFKQANLYPQNSCHSPTCHILRLSNGHISIYLLLHLFRSLSEL